MKTRVLISAVSLGVALAILYVVIPALAGLDDTWQRLSSGEPGWLVLGLGLEVLSFASYVVYLRTAFIDWQAISWGASYRITMAGVVATRLLAVAGAGGIALMAWALRRLGMPRRRVTVGMLAFYLPLYGIFMLTLLVLGVALRLGITGSAQPFPLTVVPALLGLTAIVATITIAAWGRTRGDRYGPLGASAFMLAAGLGRAAEVLRARRPGLLGAIGSWAFDIAVLWCSLRAFAVTPPVTVVVMAYFVGMLANILPVPGGIGAVDGGMIAALIGFGVDGGPALVGVLSYRAISFWLPIIPGALAYLQLLAEKPVATTDLEAVRATDDVPEPEPDADEVDREQKPMAAANVVQISSSRPVRGL